MYIGLLWHLFNNDDIKESSGNNTFIECNFRSGSLHWFYIDYFHTKSCDIILVY